MHYTYEWVLQLTTEFGFDENSDFRIEGDIIHAQGPCAVLIQSHKVSYPDMRAVERLAQRLVRDKQITKLLVFTNEYDDPRYFGSYFGALRGTGVECIPQLLGELAFNLLMATTVYLDFRDKISWRIVHYLY